MAQHDVDRNLDGLVAIVTGGAKGIGRATVMRLVAYGAKVVIADLDADSADELLLELDPMAAAFVPCDISKFGDCQNAVAHAIKMFGRLDLLANCAGIQTYGDVVSTSEEVWDQTMDVNLKGQWLMSKAAIPVMSAGASIVQVSSVQGLASQKNVLAYATSKHALIGLTRSMAVDLAASGIRVNCVCPGTVDTPMIRATIALDKDPAQLESSLNRMHPLGRIAQPAEIAEVICFLLSAKASFMTGSVVTVDGGLLVPIAGAPE